MEGNPYQKMLDIMKNEAKSIQKTWLRVGEVVKVDPLTIRIAETEQSGNHLWINEQIQNEHKETVSFVGTGSLTGQLNGNRTTFSMDEEIPDERIRVQGENVLKNCLRVGDKVLTLSEDDQIFYVLCKVVRA